MIRCVMQRQAMDCAEGEKFLFFISTESSKDAAVRSYRQSMKFFIIVALLFN